MNRALLALGLIVASASSARAGEAEPGFTVPQGFRVTQFADETLANDIYAMTLDRRGRVVATGQGYIKVLHDDNGDGKAERASLFAETRTGGMGLCFDGDDLLFCGDGWLSRYRDADRDGKADGPPEHIIPLPFAEHGGHAIRKGPDGFWYVIAGNEAKTGEGIDLDADSPIRRPEAGRIFRLSPDLKSTSVIAHGFRNPYDFDFNAQGDLFTYDSDCERDYFLPWYTPTRVYHVAHAMHHGWRLTGSSRSWARPGDYLDTVDVLQPVGRGSPTGVACYRHLQFPEHYRGGLFVLDWTFGKVYFLPLKPEGASYRASLETFIEPTGTSGFAPSDVEVAPDGSLLICIGGRRTRGAVYRIEYVGAGEEKTSGTAASPSPLDRILRAPQPLSAWSRNVWEPEAKKLGTEPFQKAIADETRPEAERIRAVEIVKELYGGLDPKIAKSVLRSSTASLRARVVWSLARSRGPESLPILVSMACGDRDPLVRLRSMEQLAGRTEPVLRDVVQVNRNQPDRRIRLAIARLIAQRGDELMILPPSPTVLLGRMWAAAEHPGRARAQQDLALEVEGSRLFEAGALRQTKLDAVRLIQLGLGDWNLDKPPIEVYSGYCPSWPVTTNFRKEILEKLEPLFPSGDERLDDELGRLLAMLEADDPSLPARVAAFWTPASTPTRDFHFLVVFSRLKGPKTDLTARVADTVLGLDRKLRGGQMRTKQTWNDRLVEVVRELVARDPKLADALLGHPAFVASAHLPIASRALPMADRPRAARKFLDAIRADRDGLDWTADLFDLLAYLPAGEIRPLFREQWDTLVFRDAIVRVLADRPEEVDRPKFLEGLGSGDKPTVEAAVSALMTLPRDPSPGHLVPAIRALRGRSLDPKKSDLPRRLVALIERQSGATLMLDASAFEARDDRRSMGRVLAWFERSYPAFASRLDAGADEDLVAFRARLASVDWSLGDRARGEKLFESRGCRTCHAGARALGPDLGGITQRLSRFDRFAAIVAPGLEVAPPYRTSLIETKDGRIVSGLVVFESADGVIVQTDAVTTVRIATPDLASRRVGDSSLMPSGLLRDLGDRDLADLDRYLQSLANPIAGSPP